MTKTELKVKHVKPKKKLYAERKRLNISASDMGSSIAINRNAYVQKENGKFPFNEYEMRIISNKLNLPIEYLFFID